MIKLTKNSTKKARERNKKVFLKKITKKKRQYGRERLSIEKI